MNKTLFVLAASVYQLPAIQTAKKMGYRIITSDNIPSNPGHTYADKAYFVDTTDLDAILAVAKKERISGIFAPATDVAVPTAAHVAHHMQLPGVPYKAAVILTNKRLFRHFLQENHFLSPKMFVPVGTDLPDDIFDKERTWIIKPAISSGSKGIFIVRSRQEFQARLEASRAMSKDGQAFVEEYIEGTQHTCEGLLEQGRVCVALITDRSTAPFPYVATCGHRVPSRLPAALQEQAMQHIERVFSLLNIQSSPFDCDFVATDTHIVLLEITPRLGGNSLSRLTQAALGIDLVAYAVAQACGDIYPFKTEPQIQPAAVLLLGVPRAGRLVWSAEAEQSLRQKSWLGYLSFDLAQGTPVEPFINGRHRVGEALLLAPSRDQLDAYIQTFTDCLRLRAE